MTLKIIMAVALTAAVAASPVAGSAHERHESHRLSLSASPAVSVYAVAFSAGLPPGDA